MENRNWNLLDEALGLDQQTEPWPLRGKVVVIQDSVETSGSFVLHQLIKRTLSPQSFNVTIFIAFSHPFSHYDRILRKLGCNLVAQRDNGRFFFFDMLKFKCPGGGNEGKNSKGGLAVLYEKIMNSINALLGKNTNHVTIMIDDVSLMEVAAHGSSDHVLDFLHYCHTLTEIDCSLVTLNHMDIYSCMDRPTFLLQMEYLADVLIKAEPLTTGLAADVHGQLTVLNQGICNGNGSLKDRISNFHFRIKENSVEYFYPGSQT